MTQPRPHDDMPSSSDETRRSSSPDQRDATTPDGRSGATSEPASWRTEAAAAVRRRRRRTLLWSGAVVLAVAAGTTAFLMNRPDPEPVVADPVPGETVTAPVPTPAVAPVERDTSTAFLAALPGEVLQWAVREQAPADDLRGAGALEAYTLTYTDGEQDLTLVTGQWRDPEAAAGAISALGLEGVPTRSEEVVAGGAPVGSMSAWANETGDRVAWTNGSSSFFVIAPPGAGESFYDAMGM